MSVPVAVLGVVLVVMLVVVEVIVLAVPVFDDEFTSQ
jgi:hypothetical protein